MYVCSPKSVGVEEAKLLLGKLKELNPVSRIVIEENNY